MEYDLLAFLVRKRGIALSRDLFPERAWGWDYDGGTRTVDVHVRWLWVKIESNPAEPMRILTVRGVGYRFEGEQRGRDVPSHPLADRRTGRWAQRQRLKPPPRTRCWRAVCSNRFAG